MSFSFDQPSMDWSHPETYSEFLWFRQHVEPWCKADKKDKAGWLGIWIGKQGREMYKTFYWDDGEEDDPKKILDKFDVYVRPRKTRRPRDSKSCSVNRKKDLTKYQFPNLEQNKRSLKQLNTCTRCGFDAKHSKYPAVSTTCNYCKKPDHWRSVCMKRNQAKMYSLEPILMTVMKMPR
uniref:Uncharacterized protein n=1 Tax=Magallana gigas TaxID=29159 RepID=A0A8W8MFP5_MAGGI